MKKILFLELNEFNLEVLQEGARRLDLKHLQRLLSLHQSVTWTDDVYESDFLEPWVQWVSVHTGIPSSVHQIKHLGDVPHLSTPQFWERLSEMGVSTGIWGAMNASRGHSPSCRFFVPDPWTASENGHPDELNALLDPVRYLSKNYLNRSWITLLSKVKNLIRLFFSNNLGKTLFQELLKLPVQLAKHGFHPYLFICLADYLSTLLFLQYRKQKAPDFSLLFLNSIAHLQHHYWEGGPIDFGLQNMNRILGHLFASLEAGEIFVVANALSQKHTKDEDPWILYRQIDQVQFLKTVGIDCDQVESLMTHDALLFFSSAEKTREAKKLLEGARIEGKPLFHVETYPQNPQKLFYRIAFTDKIDPIASFDLGEKSYAFFDLFQPIIERTGKHIQTATVLCNEPLFPEKLMNHEIVTHLLFDVFGNSLPLASAKAMDQTA